MSNLKFKLNKYIFIVFFLTIIVVGFFYNNEYVERFFIQDSVITANMRVSVKLPVIMYHNISKKTNLVDKYCVSEKRFEEDLRYIQEHGYNCITTAELIDYVYNKAELPENPFMITFDDGYESFYMYAYPLLIKYNMKAVMSIVGSYTDLFTENEDHNLDYSHLNWKQVNELNNSGFVEIQNHTYNMHEITTKRKGAGMAKGESPESFKKVFKSDLENLNTQILNYTGKKANIFTYPYGNIAEKSVDILKEIGFVGAFTCTEQVNIITGNPEELYRINRFNRDGGLSSPEFFKKIEKNLEHYSKE